MNKILSKLFITALVALPVLAACEPAPPPDKDGDGILDDADKCADKPETKNGFEDTDGCPDEKPPEKPAIPAYAPMGEDADLKKGAAAGIDETNADAKAGELEKALDESIAKLEAAKAAPAKK